MTLWLKTHVLIGLYNSKKSELAAKSEGEAVSINKRLHSLKKLFNYYSNPLIYINNWCHYGLYRIFECK